jgi:hypothetical protein
MKYIITLLAIFLTTNLGLCQEAELKSTKAKAAVRDYESKIEDVDEDFEKQLKDLEKSYQMKSEILRARLLSNLNAAMEEEAKRVRLEEATEIKELIKQRKETELPTLDKLIGRTEVKRNKVGSAKARIPRNAVSFRGHRYLLVKEIVSWHYARSQANKLGGHLLRLDSIAEHDFIITYLSSSKPSYKHVHIDGNREFDLKIWRYEDGTPVDFTKVRRGHSFAPSGPILREGSNYVHSCLYEYERGDWRVGSLDPIDLGNFIIEWDK